MGVFTNKDLKEMTGNYWQFSSDLRKDFSEEYLDNAEVEKFLRKKKVIRKGNRSGTTFDSVVVMFNTELAGRNFIGRLNSLVQEENK